MVTHKTPPKKKSTKKKATPRKTGSKRVAQTRVAKPRKRESRPAPESGSEAVVGSMSIDLASTRLSTGAAHSMASVATKSPAEIALEDEALRTRDWADGKDYKHRPPLDAPELEILSQLHVPYEHRNQGLDETYREMLDLPSHPICTTPFLDTVQYPEARLELPWYRRVWNWLKSVW